MVHGQSRRLEAGQSIVGALATSMPSPTCQFSTAATSAARLSPCRHCSPCSPWALPVAAMRRPPLTPARRAKSLRRTRKLFAFLRDHRHELFDDEMQDALEGMYRDTGAGKDPVCPAVLAMAALMQGYLGVSDAEAVQLTMVDLRWQM